MSTVADETPNVVSKVPDGISDHCEHALNNLLEYLDALNENAEDIVECKNNTDFMLCVCVHDTISSDGSYDWGSYPDERIAATIAHYERVLEAIPAANNYQAILLQMLVLSRIHYFKYIQARRKFLQGAEEFLDLDKFNREGAEAPQAESLFDDETNEWLRSLPAAEVNTEIMKLLEMPQWQNKLRGVR